MARALIVGCGCRGRELGEELLGRGWQVRGTSRSGDGVALIEGIGLDGAIADPDRPGTVLELVDGVTVVVWLLGSASGSAEALRAIHGPRLERLLQKLVDTPVRGFVYEAAGSVPDAVLGAGRALVVRAGARWRIPIATLDSVRDSGGWAAASAALVSGLVGADRSG